MTLSMLRRTARVIVGGLAVSLVAVALPAQAHTASPTSGQTSVDRTTSTDDGIDRPPPASHSETVVEPVRLEWSEVRAGEVSTLADGRLTIVATNDTPDSLRLRFGVRLLDGSDHAGRELDTVAVSPGAQATAVVDVREFGIDFESRSAPVSVVGLAQVTDSGGTLLAGAYTDSAFLHAADGSRDILAYDARVRQERFAGGDLRQPVGTSGPSALIAYADGGAGLPDRQRPAAGHTYQFCLKYQVDTVDSGFGEDFHADGDAWIFGDGSFVKGLWTAHGAKYQLFDPALGGFTEPAYADLDTGCFSFSSTATTGFKIRLHGRARFHGNNVVALKRQVDGAYVTPFWDIAADPGPGGTSVYFVDAGPESNLMGIGSSVVWRVNPLAAQTVGPDQLELMPFTEHGLSLRLLAPVEGQESPGAYYGDNWVSVPHDLSRRKFVVAHEVGHWMHDHWGTHGKEPQHYEQDHKHGIELFPGGYGFEGEQAACAFDGEGAHAMRSRENASAAFKEGLAHFLSLLAWNDLSEPDAFFKYYKASDKGFEVYNYDLIDVAANGPNPLGGVVNWNENRCGAESSEFVGYSVEGDWLRFFWDYVTATRPGIRPTLSQFAAQVSALNPLPDLTSFNVYATFLGILDGTPFEARWVALAQVHGVDYSE